MSGENSNRPPITVADVRAGRKGRPRNQFDGSVALQLLRDSRIGPAWDLIDANLSTLKTLDHWGLIDMRIIYRGRNGSNSGVQHCNVVLARLTAEGLQFRDDHHRRRAERLDRRQQRAKKKK